MDLDTAIRRAQIYSFLADVFLYPVENWVDDVPLLLDILSAAGYSAVDTRNDGIGAWDLPALQAEHRRAFGLVGSLCYETELGLPHEYRQSQEMADIAGFYRAFGFTVGGPIRERPDHLAVELEFMHLLALKEACALESGVAEHVEICRDAQGKFLQEHLGQWIGALAQSLSRSASRGPYCDLARIAAAFVLADAEHLGVKPEARPLDRAGPTPLGPEIACDGCAVAERLGDGLYSGARL